MDILEGAAVVTGAGRGIGRAIALELASLGHPVALQSRTAAQLYDTKAAIESIGGRARVVQGDVTKPAAADELVKRCEDELGPVKIAVACAGQAFSAPVLKTDPDRFRQLFEVNTMSAFHLLKSAGAAMKAAGSGGRIVVVASTAAVKGMVYTGAYSATKHAVLGLVRSAALELAKDGITVNAVCPGWVNTEMLDATVQNIADKTGCTKEEAAGRIDSMIPIGRALEPQEVASMVAYLASARASKLTGQALVLDGGESIK